MIWVVGNKGMLGTELCDVLKNEYKLKFIGTGHEVDITDFNALNNFIETQKKTNVHFSSIINCAAYTNVNKAESEKELCYKINVNGVENLAKIAAKNNIPLIHISTDYVFDGKAAVPYTENMKINPTGTYGSSKAEGEKAIQKQTDNYYIIRTAWLYGIHGNNFVKTMLRIFKEKGAAKVVSDQFGTPTYTKDLARAAAFFAETLNSKTTSEVGIRPGIYHFSDIGEISWYDFACTINDYAFEYGLITKKADISPCSTEEYPTPAPRPAYSVLSKEKISKILPWQIPDWKTSLLDYLKEEKVL